MKKIIVSRHPAAVEFIRRELPAFADAPVVAQASASDVEGAEVAGNLPLHLAAQAGIVFAVEFDGAPPRGQEYSLADMDAAGARIGIYAVQTVDADAYFMGEYQSPDELRRENIELSRRVGSLDGSDYSGTGPYADAE